MKRVLLVAIIISGFKVFSHATAMNSLYVWKASHTETQDAGVLISSEGVLAFGGVYVGSAASNGIGFVYVHDARQFASFMDTISMTNCGSMAAAPQMPFSPVRVSSGLFYTKTGDCKVDILWDLIIRSTSVIPVRVR